MKNLTVIIGLILLTINVICGLILTGYTLFNVCFTSAVIIITTILLCILQSVKMKDAFAISLGFLFSFMGMVEFVLGCLSSEQFADNGYLVTIIVLLAIEVSVILICNYISKNI